MVQSKRERGGGEERCTNLACACYSSAKELVSKLRTRVEMPAGLAQLHAPHGNTRGSLRSPYAHLLLLLWLPPRTRAEKISRLIRRLHVLQVLQVGIGDAYRRT